MDANQMFIIGLVAGGIIGWIIAWFMGRSKVAESAGRLSIREEEIKQLEIRIGQMNDRIDSINEELKTEGQKRAASEAKAERTEKLEETAAQLQQQLTDSQTVNATLKETIEQERKAVEKQLKLLEEAKTALTDTFNALAGNALKSSNEEFIKLAKSTFETLQTSAKGDLTERQKAIETLVSPLKDSLKRYEEQIATMAKERQTQYGSLENQVKSLIDSEKSLLSETAKLVTALSKPQVRGRWGEITLRRTAELAGMVEHCDFVEQVSTDSDESRKRPDMIVSLPGGRKIVIDAKTPLKAYLEATACTDEKSRKEKLVEYERQVRAQVNSLSKQDYWDQFEEAPEFVILFLPGEQFYGAALDVNPGLFEEAIEKKVVITTPTNLIALLKSIAYGWRQEALAENAMEISRLSKDFYDRIAKVVEHMQKLGRSLDNSVSAYNSAIGSLERRVLVSARRLKELGATGGEDIELVEPIDQTSRKMLPIGYEVEESEEGPTASA